MANASQKPMARCPICQAKTDAQWRPFCSARCADIDLGRWMTGAYAIPTDQADDLDRDSV